MIVGQVTATGEVTVTLKVRGPGGAANVQMLIDTGFNDQLTLPPWVIEKLGLEFRDEGDYVVAGGEMTSARLFEAQIEWDGIWRDTIVLEMENDPLLGTGILKGWNLNVDFLEGGKVEISPAR